MLTVPYFTKPVQFWNFRWGAYILALHTGESWGHNLPGNLDPKEGYIVQPGSKFTLVYA